MDFELSEEQKSIIDNADRIARKFDRAYWLECAKAKRFTSELWDELGKAGYLGITVPEEYGGAGLGMFELSLLQERLAEHGVAVLFFVVNQGLSIPALVRHGTDEQKSRLLPAIASGEKRFCFAITEPNAGTNTFKIESIARRDGDDYILNGNKLFISGINQAHHVLVVARTQSYQEVGGQTQRKEGLSLFIVDTDSKGLSYKPMDTMLLNPEGQFFVYFDNVRIPKENLLGKEGKGIRVLFDGLNPERIMAASMACGSGRWMIRRAVEYANQRVIFDKPIGAYQALQHPLAEAMAQIEVGSLMTRRAAWLQDRGDMQAGEASNMAKLVAADASLKAANAALQCFGGYGFTESQDMLSSFIGARLGTVAPINREMILNFIGEHTLGMPKSY